MKQSLWELPLMLISDSPDLGVDLYIKNWTQFTWDEPFPQKYLMGFTQTTISQNKEQSLCDNLGLCTGQYILETAQYNVVFIQKGLKNLTQWSLTASVWSTHWKRAQNY